MSKSHLSLSFLLFFCFSFIFYFGSYSKIPFGDCIGFINYAENQKFVLSTGTYAHFLFSNTLVLFQILFPSIESAVIAKFVVIFSSAAAIVVLYRIVYELTSDYFASVSCAVIFGFSFSFWKNSEIVEVYTLNVLLVSFFIFYGIKFLKNINSQKWLFLSGIFLGISLFNHIQNILMSPAFLLLLYFCKDIRSRIVASLYFLLFFFILILIPVIQKEPISGVFSSSVVITAINLSKITKSFIEALGYLLYNFWYFIPFAFYGAKFLYENYLQIFFFVVIAAGPVFGFAVIFSASDNYVFFIPFNLIYAICIGAGIFYLKEKKWTKTIVLSALFIPLFYYTAFETALLSKKGQEFHEKKLYKGGLCYYLLPWMNNNVGILEFTIENRKASEAVDWMVRGSEEFIKTKKSKGYTLKQIKKL